MATPHYRSKKGQMADPQKAAEMKAGEGFHKGQKVALVISARTPMGFLAEVNGAHKGILYQNEVFQPIKIGQEIEGFIKRVREDNKIDLCLQKPGYTSIDSVARKIMDQLQQQGGFIAVTDNTSPKRISELFGISKKSFKKAVGSLYKKRRIVIEETGIRLKDKEAKVPDRRSGGRPRRPTAR